MWHLSFYGGGLDLCIHIQSCKPIQIPYEREILEFDSEHSCCADIVALVRNVSNEPITALQFLYPRSLLSKPKQQDDQEDLGVGIVDLGDVSDLTATIPQHRDQLFANTDFHDGQLTIFEPSPNDPNVTIPNLAGFVHTDNLKFTLPNGYSNLHVELLRHYGMTAWIGELTEHIMPGTSQWFRWRIRVSGLGDSVPNIFGGTTSYHSVASPLVVRNTFKHILLAGIERFDINSEKHRVLYPAYEDLVRDLQIRQQARVELCYYHLSLSSKSSEQQLRLVSVSGDASMLGAKPKIVNGNPIFRFKSGKMLDPQHPTPGSFRIGFAIDKAADSPPAEN